MEGKRKDFRSDEWFNQWGHDKKEDDVIEVKTDNGTEAIITMPKSGIVTPRMNLAKFKKKYGKWPEVGMEVTTIVNDKGYTKIIV